jgi:hypothetical protein
MGVAVGRTTAWHMCILVNLAATPLKLPGKCVGPEVRVSGFRKGCRVRCPTGLLAAR